MSADHKWGRGLSNSSAKVPIDQASEDPSVSHTTGHRRGGDPTCPSIAESKRKRFTAVRLCQTFSSRTSIRI